MTQGIFLASRPKTSYETCLAAKKQAKRIRNKEASDLHLFSSKKKSRLLVQEERNSHPRDVNQGDEPQHETDSYDADSAYVPATSYGRNRPETIRLHDSTQKAPELRSSDSSLVKEEEDYQCSCKHHTEGTAPTNPREPADSQSSNPSTSCSTLLEMTSKGSSDSKCFVSKKERLTRIQIEDLILVVYVDDYIVLSPRK